MDLIRKFAARFSRSIHSPWIAAGQPIPDKDTVGRYGEKLAAHWLWTRGCRVLYRNFRGPKGGEVDIVCRDQNVLCFVEVKTRTSTAFGRPAAAVTLDKQELIIRGTAAYLRMLFATRDLPWRLDVVEVLLIPGEKPALNWIQSAFNTTDVRRELARLRSR